MARVLLSAYACEPDRGSEPAVGWNWATELASIGHQVTVLTRAAHRTNIESACYSGTNLRFIYYDLPSWVRRWRPLARAPYYILWQYFAARHLRRLFPSPPFDVVHHITYVSARYPSFMGSLGVRFWFGPVSGGEVVPAPLRSGFSAGQRCREWIRDLSNRALCFDPLMNQTFDRAERIFLTRDTLPLVPRRCRTKSVVRLAVGLPDGELATASRQLQSRTHGPRLLYVGRLLEWKGLDVALLTLQQIRRMFPDADFTIVGDGPARTRLEALSRSLDLQNAVHWTGWQPHHVLSDHYRAADLLLFPSLRDSGGMAVLESLAHGVPVVCTDLGGPGLVVDHTCGRAVPTSGRSQEQLAAGLAEALTELVRVPHLLESLSYGARVRARQFRFQELVRSVYAHLPHEVCR